MPRIVVDKSMKVDLGQNVRLVVSLWRFVVSSFRHVVSSFCYGVSSFRHADFWSRLLKILGLSQLVYSASNLTVPQGTADLVKTKLFRFLWRNKKDKIKRSGLYQDPDRGGIYMTDTNIMFKALKLAWIPRLIKSVNSNWCTIPNHFFKGVGGLNFLLRCNYDTKHFKDLTSLL